MRDLRLLTVGPLTLDADDIYAVWKGREEEARHSGIARFDDGTPRPTVKVFTRLRESGSRDPLLAFEFTGNAAREVWGAAERATPVGDVPRGSLVRCGQWLLRLCRVRAVRQTTVGERETYSVFVSLADGGHDGGWVARLDLDQESGTALAALLRPA